jgi:hypothetical protein
MTQQHAVNQLPPISKKKGSTYSFQGHHQTLGKIDNKKHKIGLGYGKEVTFRIPDYSRPIQFQSDGC